MAITTTKKGKSTLAGNAARNWAMGCTRFGNLRPEPDPHPDRHPNEARQRDEDDDAQHCEQTGADGLDDVIQAQRSAARRQ